VRLIEESSGLSLLSLGILAFVLMSPISLAAEVTPRDDTNQTDIESKADTASDETESDMAESTGGETTTDESDSTNDNNSSTESNNTSGCGCGTTGNRQVPVSWLLGGVLLGFARTYRGSKY
jgi:hypothetical protein